MDTVKKENYLHMRKLGEPLQRIRSKLACIQPNLRNHIAPEIFPRPDFRRMNQSHRLQNNIHAIPHNRCRRGRPRPCRTTKLTRPNPPATSNTPDYHPRSKSPCTPAIRKSAFPESHHAPSQTPQLS